ncbi:hypothetical protein SOP91_00255 (plasmid) [Enterobacter hormaechei]|uniref:hypothetical protein n=1 Tax=Enterobacter hormaechei TaxID=158836 RepID=UPI002B4C1D48|nr:hypothetical protein [Enterobacter hormaechei]WRM07063.1 hypothetical protein SOP91_00255 [Enterobacter hormaechei]
MLRINAKRTTNEAVSEAARSRAALIGWTMAGALRFRRRGLMIHFAGGVWTLYRNNMIDHCPLFCSSYLIAVIDAAKEF